MSQNKIFSAKNLPDPGLSANTHEKKLLQVLVNLIEEHADGFYENGLDISYRSGTGVTEYEALLNPAYRKYLQKPDNIYLTMEKLVANMSENECRLYYCVLIEIEKRSSRNEEILIGKIAKDASFDVDEALEKAKPIIDYYLLKRRTADIHKVPGKDYKTNFMNIPGLRPNTKVEPLLVTEHLIYHASCAIILDALKLLKYNEAYQVSHSKFEHDKKVHRQCVWKIVSMPGYLSNQETDEYMPTLDKNAFFGITFPGSVRVCPAFVAIRLENNILIETSGAVAIHPDNQNCLIEFIDHTLDEPKTRYGVSQNEPPMTEVSKAKVFNNITDAIVCWNAQKTMSCPFAQFYMASV